MVISQWRNKPTHKRQGNPLWNANATKVRDVIRHIEDFIWPCGDTKFLFQCWKRSERSNLPLLYPPPPPPAKFFLHVRSERVDVRFERVLSLIFFFYFFFPPRLARLFCGQGTIMICIQSVLINLNLELETLRRPQDLDAWNRLFTAAHKIRLFCRT